MKDSLLFITEKPTDSLSSGMDKRPILITLLITLLGSVSDLLDFQRFSGSHECFLKALLILMARDSCSRSEKDL